jgi:hypothetical protein
MRANHKNLSSREMGVDVTFSAMFRSPARENSQLGWQFNCHPNGTATPNANYYTNQRQKWQAGKDARLWTTANDVLFSGMRAVAADYYGFGDCGEPILRDTGLYSYQNSRSGVSPLCAGVTSQTPPKNVARRRV